MRKIIHAASAMALAAALGFGGRQAMAAPAAAPANTVAACNSMTCGTACFNKGYPHWSCWNGNCQCSFGTPI